MSVSVGLALSKPWRDAGYIGGTCNAGGLMGARLGNGTGGIGGKVGWRTGTELLSTITTLEFAREVSHGTPTKTRKFPLAEILQLYL
jgi:hypothetical protein